MMPQTLARLESFATSFARVRPNVGVDALVGSYSRRVLEEFATEATLLFEFTAVLEQLMFLQMITFFESDIADAAHIGSFV